MSIPYHVDNSGLIESLVLQRKVKGLKDVKVILPVRVRELRDKKLVSEHVIALIDNLIATGKIRSQLKVVSNEWLQFKMTKLQALDLREQVSKKGLVSALDRASQAMDDLLSHAEKAVKGASIANWDMNRGTKVVQSSEALQ